VTYKTGNGISDPFSSQLYDDNDDHQQQQISIALNTISAGTIILSLQRHLWNCGDGDTFLTLHLKTRSFIRLRKNTKA
jgi:DNA-binding ferritin-like protein